MKKVLFIMLVPVFFLSCHKHKNNTCGGYFLGISMISVSNNGGTLFTVNANNGNIVNNYAASLQVSNLYSGVFGVYDHIHNNYYLFGWGNTNHGILYSFNTNTGATQLLGYPTLLDTPTGGYINISLACNSTTGKLYFYGSVDSVNEIYEVVPGAASFTQRLVYASTTTGIGSLVIDEKTGYLYIVSGALYGTVNLIKVDPASGVSTVVTTYASAGYSGMIPSLLVYNNNDGLFYGLNIYSPLYPPPSGPIYTPFISIDPANGSVNTLNATTDYTLGTPFAFDYCNNLYVIFEGQGAVWLDPSSGNIAKQVSYPFNSGSIDTSGLEYIACINNPIP